MVTVICRP